MNEMALNETRVNEARMAILQQFLDRDIGPNGVAPLFFFQDELNTYRGGYFEEAMQKLMIEQWVEIDILKRFRLTEAGYVGIRTRN
jgi:hypothetical protein